MVPFILFKLGTLYGAFPLKAVREVLPLPTLSRPPSSPAFLKGFLNLEGTLIPILNLFDLLNLPPIADDLYSHLLHLGTIGIWVEQTLDIVTAEPRPIQKDQVFNDCVEAEFSYQQHTVYLFSPEGLLLAEEQTRIEALKTMEQKRLQALENTHE